MSLSVPFQLLSRQTEAVVSSLDEAYRRVIRSGWFILGSEGTMFEEEFAAYCGAQHAVGVGNGSDALEIALRALGISAGDRVATVANAGGYTTGALLAVGAKPVPIDVEPHNQLVSLDHLETVLVSGSVTAMVVTHLFGRMADVEAITTICDRHGVAVIEDCAQAHGAMLRGRRAGSIGRIGCFSFYPTKNLGALGDGGAVVTSDPGLDERLRRLRQYGWEKKYNVAVRGGRNSRLDELQAAFLRAKLPFLDRWNERRRSIARQYGVGITNPRVSPAVAGAEDYVAHLYVVRCGQRDELMAHLRGLGIGCDIHYPVPDNLQPAWVDAFSGTDLPVTERLAGEVLSLPCYPELRDDEVQTIIQSVNGW